MRIVTWVAEFEGKSSLITETFSQFLYLGSVKPIFFTTFDTVTSFSIIFMSVVAVVLTPVMLSTETLVMDGETIFLTPSTGLKSMIWVSYVALLTVTVTISVPFVVFAVSSYSVES